MFDSAFLNGSCVNLRFPLLHSQTESTAAFKKIGFNLSFIHSRFINMPTPVNLYNFQVGNLNFNEVLLVYERLSVQLFKVYSPVGGKISIKIKTYFHIDTYIYIWFDTIGQHPCGKNFLLSAFAL